MFQVIMAADDGGRVEKYATFETMAEAEAHIERASERYPNAFIADDPPGSVFDWQVMGGAITHRPGHKKSVRESDEPTLEERVAALDARIAVLEDK